MQSWGTSGSSGLNAQQKKATAPKGREGYTYMPQVRLRAGIILLNCGKSETCNKKGKTPLHDHLKYVPVQNPLSERHKDHT